MTLYDVIGDKLNSDFVANIFIAGILMALAISAFGVFVFRPIALKIHQIGMMNKKR